MDIFTIGRVVNRLDRCGFFLCRKGCVKVQIDDMEVEVKSGDACIYMPSALLRPISVSDDAEGIMVSIDIDYVVNSVTRISSIENLIYIRYNPCVRPSEETFGEFETLLTTLWNKQKKMPTNVEPHRRRLYTEQLKSMGEVVLYEVIGLYLDYKPLAKDTILTKKDNIFYQFIMLLYKNFKNEREVSFYAEQLGLTSRYFSSVVKEKSGSTAMQWITHVVIGEMKKMLEYTDITIKEMSEMMNFPTQSFFGKYFKQYTGYSPKEYRIMCNNLVDELNDTDGGGSAE